MLLLEYMCLIDYTHNLRDAVHILKYCGNKGTGEKGVLDNSYSYFMKNFMTIFLVEMDRFGFQT